MHVLVVAPHFDDAALSVGQSLLDGELSRERVTVGVVFSRSNWTQWAYPNRRRAPVVSVIRRAEEQWAALRFHFRIVTGGLEEVILRTGTTEPEQLLDADFDPATDPTITDVIRVLDTWVTSGRYDIVLAPLGVGHHVDHQLVAAAAHELRADSPVPIAHYEDRPYASVADDDSIAATAAALDGSLSRRPLSGSITSAKTSRLFYPSQFDRFFSDAMADDERDHRHEFAWVPPGATWPTT